MNRRDFLRFSSASAVVAAADLLSPDIAHAEGEAVDTRIVEAQGFSIMQGLTTETSTQLTIDVPKHMVVHYHLIDASTGRTMTPLFQKSASRKKNVWRVDKVGYIDLPYMGQFIFRVIDDKGHMLDERYLRLLDTNKKDARIAFLSCMFDMNLNHKKMWPIVEAADCDMLFFVGDNVYGDILLVFDGPTLLWNRYINTRRRLGFYHWKHLKPVLCTWDDHDYGLNNAVGNYEHKEKALETFNAFTAQEPIADGFARGPGVSSIFKAFGQKFVLLDDRYFRCLEYDGIKGYFGKEQLEWAFSHMNESPEPNWIMQGSQFYMGEGYSKDNESYHREAPEELKIFSYNIRQLNSPCAFVAGDIHFTEICRAPKEELGYKTVEIASSCLHSLWTTQLPKNPNRICAAVKENFVVVDLLNTRFDMAFKLTGIGIKNKIWFEDEFGV